MKIAYFSNFINHHQIYVARELYRLTGGNFYFVEAKEMPNSFKKNGYPNYSDEPFVIRCWQDKEQYENARRLALDADVVLYTPYAFDLVKNRLISDKISIDVGERWLKQGVLNLFSPLLLKMQWFYHTRVSKANNYKLCASAYGTKDQYLLHSFIDKCYKWGYFTKVDELDVSSLPVPRNGDVFSIMWCARMIDWKHPELAINLAVKLKKAGYKFILDMYGGGVLLEKLKKMALKLEVADVLHFCGNMPNEQILQAMRKHDVFIFTSDQNEGWGAVANEAMANGCVLVGSDQIGSIPFLVKDGENGCIFKSKKTISLFEKVQYLIEHPNERQQLSIAAYKTISTVWSPTNAARNLIVLINDLLEGRDSSILDGPCSKADLI